MYDVPISAFWVCQSIASAMELTPKAERISGAATEAVEPARKPSRKPARWKVVAQWVLSRPLRD